MNDKVSKSTQNKPPWSMLSKPLWQLGWRLAQRKIPLLAVTQKQGNAPLQKPIITAF